MAGYLGLRAAGLRPAAIAVGIAAVVVYVGSLFVSISMSVAAARRIRKERGPADERRDRELHVP